MKQMFQSATVKLTAWYLLILMGISLLFSVIIYQISRAELDARFNSFSSRIERETGGNPEGIEQLESFRVIQLHESEARLFFALFYTNLLILVASGCGSYLLARRSLRPIEESHEAQSRFTSDASHELRTPLAVMKSELEVALRDKKLTKADMRELLESNLEEVNRLSDLSNVLLKLSKQDFSGLELTKIKLNDIVRKVANLHEKNGKKRIKLHLGKEVSQLDGNESSLVELLVILVDNALQYSPDDSLVHIYTKRRSGSTILEITNEGKGISADDLPHIFERFYRGEKSRTSSESSGYGLGLSLAKKIVDLHDGDIKITSVPGKTTSVTIVFRKRL